MHAMIFWRLRTFSFKEGKCVELRTLAPGSVLEIYQAVAFTITYVHANSLSGEEWVSFLIRVDRYKEHFHVT